MAENTFKEYSAKQATCYAIARGASYPAEIYQEILAYHEKSQGKWHCYMDVGCGPGNSTHDLAPFFDKAIGVDHSQEMINAANSAGFQAKSGPIQFAVSNAEHFDELVEVPEGGVDLISAGMAAHWFDMNVFWKKAAKVLAPGGTVALWTYSSLYCPSRDFTYSTNTEAGTAAMTTYSHFNGLRGLTNILDPDTPSASSVQEMLLDLENNTLGEYALPGNIVSQHMYEKLALPWDISPPETAFDRFLFTRREWNRDGKLDSGRSEFLGGWTQTMERFAKSGRSASMYTRWAAANPNIAGADEDCVTVMVQKIQSLTGLRNQDTIKLGCGIALLLFSKQ